jgi:BirA family biotin operon repressor/biotin-[acetyl-CoA-carboxylase] ligase
VTIRWHDRVSSTMDLAAALAASGARHGEAVAAREQEAGRGRRGRSWVSPAGGLWLSVICRPEGSSTVECLSLRAGLGIAHAIELALPGIPTIAIKWPNDLYLGGRKVAGVLCEARWEGPVLAWVLVGAGVNVANPLPDWLRESAAWLGEWAAGARPEDLAEPVAEAVARAGLVSGPLTPVELEEFARRDWLRGRTLSAPSTGRCAGISPDGALLVEAPDGRVAPVTAGEVLAAAS